MTRRFDQFGFPLVVDNNIIPNDKTTLFVCSGMQNLKDRFRNPDGQTHGSLQSCIRTNDLDLVGDGTHLTFFQMLGSFSFRGKEYEVSVELWHSILKDLGIGVTSVHCHPERPDHISLWERRGYSITLNPDCTWSDGDVSGHCCEIFCGDLEIGNLVNPLGHSTDVGFGWERLHMVIEGKTNVHETSLFRQGSHPIVMDHSRTLDCLWDNGVKPGNKGREYVCRRLVRRMLPHLNGETFRFDEWVVNERRLRERSFKSARKYLKNHGPQPVEWWKDTFGLLPEEVKLL